MTLAPIGRQTPPSSTDGSRRVRDIESIGDDGGVGGPLHAAATAAGASESGRVAGLPPLNIAAPARTTSVTKNRLLAAGYHGAKYVDMHSSRPTPCAPS
jgi:hypothetical protein